MSLTDPVPPVPQHTPPVEEKSGLQRFTTNWMQWFLQLRDKVNVINESLVSLGLVTDPGILAKQSDGSWAVRTITGTADRVSVDNGDGSNNPIIDIEDEGIQDIVAAMLQAGTNVTLDYNDTTGQLTINATGGGGGGGGGGPWEHIATWDQTIDGNTTGFEVDVSGYTDCIVFVINVTLSVSGWRFVAVSVDGGANYLNTAGYGDITTAGVFSDTNAGVLVHGTSSSAARSGFVQIPLYPDPSGYIPALAPARTIPAQCIQTSSPITNLKIYANGPTLNGGVIQVYGKPTSGGGTTETWTIVKKTVDESRNTNDTLTADTDLIVELSANTTYRIKLWVVFTMANATMGMQYGHNFTGTYNSIYFVRHQINPATSAGLDNEFSHVSTSSYGGAVTTSVSGPGALALELIIDVATAGTFSFTWAQQVSNASNLTILKGSYLEYTTF